jgi:hypothetical protein
MLDHDRKHSRELHGANFLVFVFLLAMAAGLSVDGCEFLRMLGKTPDTTHLPSNKAL